ncbi:MAG: class I mannose-6-phosphate isomerase [Planctomycetes bacterium]|nr:class I mannose-6-phosphate isomerase [Planctomycetota bacterium]
MQPYPLRFEPIYKPKPWGGRRMAEVLGKPIPEGPIGESWEVADCGGDSTRVSAGPRAGQGLHELVQEDAAALLGATAAERAGGLFPLILKFLDVKEPLSIQVHPNDAAALRLEGPGARGKTEAWSVVAAGPEARVYRGLRGDVDRGALAAAAREGRVAACLRSFRPAVGDTIFVGAGTVHSAADVLLVEVQQSSDLTYRLHDWGREAASAPRELHVAKALEVIDWSPPFLDKVPSTHMAGPPFARRRLCGGAHFVLERWEVSPGRHVGPAEADRCWLLAFLGARGAVEGGGEATPFEGGATVLVPAGLPFHIAVEPGADATVIASFPRV